MCVGLDNYTVYIYFVLVIFILYKFYINVIILFCAVIPNSGHVENGKPDTKVSPIDTNKNSEQRSANHTPSSSPPTSNNLVAVNT